MTWTAISAIATKLQPLSQAFRHSKFRFFLLQFFEKPKMRRRILRARSVSSAVHSSNNPSF